MKDFNPVASDAVSQTLAALVQATWTSAAAEAGVDLTSFNGDAPLGERLAWAREQRLGIAAVLARSAVDSVTAIQGQLQACAYHAARHGLYSPPEFVGVESGLSGHTARRPGLSRCATVLRRRLADVLLVTEMTRLFRTAGRAVGFLRQLCVDRDVPVISVDDTGATELRE